jgi:hypothetical protein
MKTVQELLRGEKSAIESIDAVLKKIKDNNEREQLSSIRQDHVNAVKTLTQYATTDDIKAGEGSGPWGAFTKAFAGGASFFGDKAALQALKIGEEHGLSEYKELIQDNAVDQDLRKRVVSELIPQQERHLSQINSYLQ